MIGFILRGMMCFITLGAFAHCAVAGEPPAVVPLIIEENSETTSMRQQEEYTVGTENVLSIKVYYGKEGEELERKVRVSSKGTISFPLLEEIYVEGLTVPQLEQKMTDLLKADYFVNPQVSVFIEEYSTISVTGEVSKPGQYPLQGHMTLIQAITQAGGFTKISAPNSIKIIREEAGKKHIIKVRAYDIIKKGDTEQDVLLRSGDIVIVPESVF